MTSANRVILLIAVLCFASVAAKPAKSPPLRPPPPFFKTTGEPFDLEKSFPGVTAALLLSDQQKIALIQAHQQTVRNPDLRNKMSAIKTNDKATPTQQEELRREIDDARAQLRKRVEAILTPEQRDMAIKIENAATDAEHEANEIFDAEFNGAKGDAGRLADVREKARVEAEDILVQKLEKFLTPAQMQAIQQSATAQRAAAELAAKMKN